MTRLLTLVFAALLIAPTVKARAQGEDRVIYTSVVTNDGEPVLDLSIKDFIVREDGQSREILSVARDNDPLQIALLVDNSAVMRNQLSDLRRALTAFVDATREGVQIALITLAERPTIAVGYTADHAALHKGIDKLFAFAAGNYLLDGIAETSQGLAKRTMWRSVIVVITGTGPELSYRQYTEVLRFFREGGAALHVLNLGAMSGNAGREIVLSRGTAQTGGRYETIFSATGLPVKARQLAMEVSNQYRVTFARPERLVPPKTTEVAVKRADLKSRGMLLKTDKDSR
jgi:VWFA-related protein